MDNKLKKFFLIGSILTLIGCSSNKFVYRPSRDYFKGINFEQQDEREFLQHSLDDLITSGIFNEKSIEKIIGLKYSLQEETIQDSKIIRGEAEPLDNSVKVYYKFPSDKDSLFIYKLKFSKALVHEISHHFWDSFFTKKEKKEFEEIIRNYELKYYFLSATPEKERKYHESGFSEETFWNFKILMERKRTYMDIYGRDFNRRFYGDEAFATIMEEQFREKKRIRNIEELIKDKSKVSLEYFETARRIIHEEKDFIPKKLVPFYRKIFNEN